MNSYSLDKLPRSVYFAAAGRMAGLAPILVEDGPYTMGEIDGNPALRQPEAAQQTAQQTAS